MIVPTTASCLGFNSKRFLKKLDKVADIATEIFKIIKLYGNAICISS